MRIVAISAYVPRERYTAPPRVHEPRQVVTVAPPAPIEAGAMAAAMLSGRGIIVDVMC